MLERTYMLFHAFTFRNKFFFFILLKMSTQ